MISEFYKHFSVQVERIRNKAYVANFACFCTTLTVCQQHQVHVEVEPTSRSMIQSLGGVESLYNTLQ
jgi:hypothetical protein